MKTTRSLTILAGLTLALFALSATGAKAQIISTTTFSGSFTLPVATQWGGMTLPAGTYTLQYGYVNGGNAEMVEIAGKAKGSVHGVLFARGNKLTSAKKSSLVCVREGNTLVVRTLVMSAIGESLEFALPHRTKLMARSGQHNNYTQLAEAPMLIERIPVTLNEM